MLVLAGILLIFMYREIISMKKKNGFSLIELMTVIIIIGIMLGIAIPTLTRNLPYRRLLDGRSQVKSDLSLMRQKSLVESSSYGAAILASNTNQYILFEDLNNNNAYDNSSDRLVKMVNLPTRINFDLTSDLALTFLHTGILDSGTSVDIRLKNDRNEQKTLTVMLSGVVVD